MDGFTYDGSGLDVYFYLGSDNTASAFAIGLQIGPQLLGTVFDGSGPPIVIDLPAGQTIGAYEAISVWCTVARVSFGSGSFSQVPEPAAPSFLALAAIAAAARRRRVGSPQRQTSQ